MCYFDISEYLLTLYLEPNTSEKTSEFLEYAQTMLMKVRFESNDKVACKSAKCLPRGMSSAAVAIKKIGRKSKQFILRSRLMI